MYTISVSEVENILKCSLIMFENCAAKFKFIVTIEINADMCVYMKLSLSIIE